MSVMSEILKSVTPKDVFRTAVTFKCITDNRAYFQKPLGSERVKESQKLLKSAEKYFYPTFSSF